MNDGLRMLDMDRPSGNSTERRTRGTTNKTTGSFSSIASSSSRFSSMLDTDGEVTSLSTSIQEEWTSPGSSTTMESPVRVSKSNSPSTSRPSLHQTTSPTARKNMTPCPPSSLFSLLFLILTTLTLLPLPTHAQSLPQVDFGRMGTVTLTGSFVGVDFYDSSSSSTSSGSEQGSGDEKGDALVLRRQGRPARFLGRTEEGGVIHTVCAPSAPSSGSDGDGEEGEEVYLGGNFTSFAGTDSMGLVRVFIPTTGDGAVRVDPIGQGGELLGEGEGEVRAIYCGGNGDDVWVGRSGVDEGTEGSVVILDRQTMDIRLPPFRGLNGSVFSISPSLGSGSGSGSGSDPRGLIFGGSFSTVFRTDGQNTSSITENTTTVTLDEILQAYPGGAPEGTVTTGYSRYLTSLSLTNASIDAGPSAPDGGSVAGITCPAGAGADDGGGAYYGRDGSAVKVTVRLFRELRAVGVRLGNTFSGGKGTSGFRVVTIPDNAQRTLIYTDPSTGSNATCSDRCPLSSNSSIVAQDFLFQEGTESITGFQVYLEEWTGDGVGLSRLQLLSSGGTAEAVDRDNYPVCGSSGSQAGSNVEQTGTWTDRDVDTSISGTVQSVAIASVDNGSGERPSTTWYPYISSSGNYSVYLNVPGCQRMGDCASRTDVDVGVFPYAGSLGYTSSIQQTNEQDTRELVYSGYMQGSQQGAFQSTVRLALGSNPGGTSSGRWEVVAGSVTLEYNAAVTQNGTRIPLVTGLNQTITVNSTELGNLTSAGNSTTGRAFGLFEWIEGGAEVDATRVLGNETETAVTRLGFALQNARGDGQDARVRTIVTLNDVIYAAGQFEDQGNFSNVVALKDGTVSPLAQQGLNGLVSAAVVAGNQVFFGGDFTGIAEGSTTLNRLARYNPADDSWNALAGGVDGPVSALQAGSGEQIIVVGNFTSTIDSDGRSTETGGYAVWNTKSETWTTSGIVVGTVNGIALDDDQTYLAGRISGVSDNAANGIAYLSGSGDDASISAGDIDFASNASSSNPARKRNILPYGHPTRTWMNRFSEALRKRQASGPVTPAVTAQDDVSEAPTILTAAYWTNTSASGSPTVTCIGGNFSLANSQGTSLGFYDQESKTTTSLNGQQPIGVVRSLEVIDDTLVVAGNFVLGEQNSIASYNLASGSWNSAVPGLNNGTGAGDVYVVRKQPNADMLIAAGAFTTAGSLPCVGVCAWDLATSRWSALGSGLSRGSVRAIEFVDQSLLIAGAFTLSDGTAAYVAKYDFGSSAWTALASDDQLSGPVTAMTLDDGDVNKIYAAGISSSNGEPYLQRWNGQSWETQAPSLLSGTQVASMAMVPLATEYSDSQMMENDRMLMVVGSLVLPDSGNSTAALYDGQAWHPYLTSVGRNGNDGAGASGLFYSIHDFSFHTRHYLALGLIVLIALAISTGLIFLLVLIGLLIAFWWGRHRKQNAPPPVVTTLMEKRPSSDYGDTDSLRLRRLGAIQQAVFGSSAVAATSFANASKAQSPRDTNTDDARSSFGYDSTSQGHAMGAQTADTHEESSSPSHMGRPTTVKYNFEAVDPAELSVCEGDHVNVLEEDESEQWWYVRDREGREGVVPASYLW